MAGLVSKSWFTSGLFSDPCRDPPWQNPCSYTADAYVSLCCRGWGLLPTTPKRPRAAADFSSGYFCTADSAWKLERRVLLLVLRVRLGVLTHSTIHSHEKQPASLQGESGRSCKERTLICAQSGRSCKERPLICAQSANPRHWYMKGLWPWELRSKL